MNNNNSEEYDDKRDDVFAALDGCEINKDTMTRF